MEGYVMVIVVSYVGTLGDSRKKTVLGIAHATCHRTVFRHCIAYSETNHTIVALAVTRTAEFLGYHLKSIAAIEVVGIDDGKRLIDHTLAHKNRVVRTPRLCTVGRAGKSFRQSVGRLKHDLHRHMTLIFGNDLFTKILLEILSDDKHYFSESRFNGIIDRVVHDGFSIGAKRIKLLETSVPATHAGG